MMRFVDVALRDDIPNGERLRIDVEGRDVVIFNIDGKYHALNYRCPHTGGPLGAGPVCDGAIRCPQHHWLFDVKTGVTRRDRRVKARVYPIEVEGETLRVGIE